MKPAPETIVPCRGCGETTALMVVSCGATIPQENTHRREQVQCFKCLSRGPSVPSEYDGKETAWQAWNRVNVAIDRATGGDGK